MKTKIKYKNEKLVVETDISIQDEVIESLQQEYGHDKDLVIVRNENSNLEIGVRLLEAERIASEIHRARTIAIQIIESAKSIIDKMTLENTLKHLLENLLKDVKGSVVAACGLKVDDIGVAITVLNKSTGAMRTCCDIHPILMINHFENGASKQIIKEAFSDSREVN